MALLSPIQEIFSQQVWTLEMCIEYGLEHSADIRIKELEGMQARNMQTSSYMNLLPQVNSISSWHIHPASHFSSSMEISLNLFDGLSGYNSIMSSRSALSAKMDDILDTRQRVRIAITKRYLDVLLGQELLKIAQEGYDIIAEQYSISELLYENGESAYSTLLEIESQKSSEMVKMIEAENTLSTHLISLLHLISYPLSEDFVIAQFVDTDTISAEVSIRDIESLYQSALELPYITSARHALKSSMYDAKAAAGGVMPSISLNVGYDVVNFGENIGIGIRIPIFNRGSVLTGVKNAALNVNRSEIELEERCRELYREVSLSVREAISCRHQYAASLDHLRAAEESFRHIAERFRLGMVTSADYNSSKNTLSKAQSEAAQAKYRYIFQLKILEIYRGEED